MQASGDGTDKTHSAFFDVILILIAVAMFHTLLILGYTIPNIYVFFRIRQLFINKGYRLHYTVLYLAAASIYPLSLALQDSTLAAMAEKISDYLLPFYLYLFLFILLFDIFLLANLILKVVPSEKLETTRSKRNILGTIMIMSVTVVTGGIINFNTIRTSEYKIDIPAKSSGLDHLRIAFLADFHLQEGTPVSFVGRFADKIREINPDIVLYGGDIAEGRTGGTKIIEFERIIKSTGSSYGSFAVIGNHEHYSGNDNGNFFERSNITLLRDTVIVINHSFSLAGRNDSRNDGRKTARELLAAAPDSLPVIVLDHRPSDIIEVSSTKADVQFSGHTHDGQLFPISLITKNMYELSHGYRKIGNTHFFVTSGIRLWGPRVRTAGKSEIMVVDINFSD